VAFMRAFLGAGAPAMPAVRPVAFLEPCLTVTVFLFPRVDPRPDQRISSGGCCPRRTCPYTRVLGSWTPVALIAAAWSACGTCKGSHVTPLTEATAGVVKHASPCQHCSLLSGC